MFKNLNPGMIGIHATLAEAMDMAAQYGFGGVDVNLPDVAELVRETSVGEVRDLLRGPAAVPATGACRSKWHDSEQGSSGRKN